MNKHDMTMHQSDLAKFSRKFFNSETPLSQIGSGEIGGKALGLARINKDLETQLDAGKYPGLEVYTPPLVVITTDIFDKFMQQNGLDQIAFSETSDSRLAQSFQKADLPFEVLGDLHSLIEQVHTPFAVRSSSLLEDSYDEPFAGIYATKMIPNNKYDVDLRYKQLLEAIKFVYASTYSRTAKNYRRSIGRKDEEEKMAVIIQEAVGKRYHNRFYPELSGVARSYNYYPMQPATQEQGVVSLALGLGKTIVEGGKCWSYSPAYPKIPPPFGSVEDLLNETQTNFWVVNMGEPLEYDSMKETEYLLLENLRIAERDGILKHLASTYSPISGRLSIGTGFDGPRALTFAPILELNEIALNSLIVDLLKICENSLSTPVEIEFAMTFDPHRVGFLQVRSMIAPTAEISLNDEEMVGEDILVASDQVLGYGIIDTIQDIVYVKPETFDLKQTQFLVEELERINQKLLSSGTPYLLIVLGRLGTTDPWLGIPILWEKICGAKVVVEATQANVRVELSQGAHYFQNIVSLGVKYFTLPFASKFSIDWDWLAKQEVMEETAFIRHVVTARALSIKVAGRSGKGVIKKNSHDEGN